MSETTVTYYPDDGADYHRVTEGGGDAGGIAEIPTVANATWDDTTVRIGHDGKSGPQLTSFFRYHIKDIPRGSTGITAKWTVKHASASTTALAVKVGIPDRDNRWERTPQTYIWHTNQNILSTVYGPGGGINGFGTLGSGADLKIDPTGTGILSVGQVFRPLLAEPTFDRCIFVMRRIGSRPSSSVYMDAYTVESDSVWRPKDLVASSAAVSFNSIATSNGNVTFTFSPAVSWTSGKLLFVLRHDIDNATNTLVIQANTGLSVTSEPPTALQGAIYRGSQPGFGALNYAVEREFPHPTAEASDVLIAGKMFNELFFGSFDLPDWVVGNTTSFGDASKDPDYTMALGDAIKAWIDDPLYDVDETTGRGPNPDSRVFALCLDSMGTGTTVKSIYAENNPSELGAALEITFTPPPLVPTPVDFTPSETSIANAALILLGERRIDSLNDDTKSAKLVADRFPEARDELLRLIPWNFATARAKIPASATAPVWEFARAFPLPEDCIRLLSVDNPVVRAYRVEAGEVVTNIESPLSIEYTKRVTDALEMDPDFRGCLAAMLAWELAEAITGSSAKIEEVAQILRDRLEAAGASNGQESDPSEINAYSEFIASRGRETH